MDYFGRIYSTKIFLSKKASWYMSQKSLSERKFRCHQANKYSLREAFVDVNEDICTIPNHVAAFSKSLRHDNEIVDPKQFHLMRNGLLKCPCFFKKIEYPGSLMLVSPSAIYSKDFVGPFKHTNALAKVPSMTSDQTSGEMVELYNMMLLRDVKWCDYDTHPDVNKAVNDLNQLSHFNGPKENNYVTSATLFRGDSLGDVKGPYVSQFLYLPFNNGVMTVEQKSNFYQEGHNLLTTSKDILDVQDGIVNGVNPPRNVNRYISTLRDGATFVHHDNPITSGFDAVSILYSLKFICQDYKYVYHTVDRTISLLNPVRLSMLA